MLSSRKDQSPTRDDMRPGRRSLAIGPALAVIDFAIGRCASAFDVRWLIIVQDLLWLSTLIYVTYMILETIFEDKGVTIETLQASLCVSLLIGLIWSLTFVLIDLGIPGSFQVAQGPGVVWSDPRSRAIEFMRHFVFSDATLSGASDASIGPSTGFASNAASLEAMSGQICLAVVIARLVGLYSSRSSRSTPGES